MAVEQVTVAHGEAGPEGRVAIQEQLERLLANPHFSHSRRFPSFLRFAVEKTLSGETDLLKERTLGIEIFAREAEYDTASDPIVRNRTGSCRLKSQLPLVPPPEEGPKGRKSAFHGPAQACERDNNRSRE